MSDEWQDYLKDERRICKYGVNCYQKNPDHLNKFKHPPQKFKGKAQKVDNNKRKNARYSPYTRNEKVKNLDETEEKIESPSSSEVSEVTTTNTELEEEKADKPLDSNISESTATTDKRPSADTETDSISNNFTKIVIDETTQYYDKDSDHKIFRECFLVDMPSDFFTFYECLKNEEGSLEKLLSGVNLELIGPFDLLLGKLPIIEDKDLYLIHWRFYYDPPEYQAVLKKKGKSEYHIGYFRDSPDEKPVFLAENNSEKDCTIKPIANNIFGAVYYYLQNEKKTSPFVSVACQKLMEKISKWAQEHYYTLEEFNMKSRQQQTVCKSFHGAGIVVPYNKKTQLGYRSLAESNAKLKKLFKQLSEAKSQKEKDKILSELQPVITYASIAVDECDFGTGLEAGIALFCSGLKELEFSAKSLLQSVYPLLKREAFAKITQVHMKYRRKGPEMSIING